jgi:hypothetical protein
LTHLVDLPSWLDDDRLPERSWSTRDPGLLWCTELSANIGLHGRDQLRVVRVPPADPGETPARCGSASPSPPPAWSCSDRPTSTAAVEDTAIILFSVFMVVAAISLIVAGDAVIRARAGTSAQRGLVLAAGIWPLATIPAAAAIGDDPHFLAITVWGALWVAAGATLLAADR